MLDKGVGSVEPEPLEAVPALNLDVVGEGLVAEGGHLLRAVVRDKTAFGIEVWLSDVPPLLVAVGTTGLVSCIVPRSAFQRFSLLSALYRRGRIKM